MEGGIGVNCDKYLVITNESSSRLVGNQEYECASSVGEKSPTLTMLKAVILSAMVLITEVTARKTSTNRAYY